MSDQTTPTPSPVVTATVRTITPVIVAALVYALAKANIKIDNTLVSVVVNSVVSAVAATGYKFAVSWLETVKSSKWGRLFFIAKAPVYPPTPTPVEPTEVTQPLSIQAPVNSNPSTATISDLPSS